MRKNDYDIDFYSKDEDAFPLPKSWPTWVITLVALLVILVALPPEGPWRFFLAGVVGSGSVYLLIALVRLAQQAPPAEAKTTLTVPLTVQDFMDPLQRKLLWGMIAAALEEGTVDLTFETRNGEDQGAIARHLQQLLDEHDVESTPLRWNARRPTAPEST